MKDDHFNTAIEFQLMPDIYSNEIQSQKLRNHRQSAHCKLLYSQRG